MKLTDQHVQYLAAWLFRTRKAESVEAAIAMATEQVAEANRVNALDASKKEAARRQEEAHRLQGCCLANQQSSARQRSIDRTLRRLTVAVVALGRR